MPPHAATTFAEGELAEDFEDQAEHGHHQERPQGQGHQNGPDDPTESPVFPRRRDAFCRARPRQLTGHERSTKRNLGTLVEKLTERYMFHTVRQFMHSSLRPAFILAW
jgi:hypothetical protein